MAIADRFIDLGGLRLHYREVGDPAAAPVVLLVTLGGGHCMHAERRDQFVGALRAFLRGDGDRRVG